MCALSNLCLSKCSFGVLFTKTVLPLALICYFLECIFYVEVDIRFRILFSTDHKDCFIPREFRGSFFLVRMVWGWISWIRIEEV